MATATTTVPAAKVWQAPESVPALVAGDKLTLEEFLRRWEAMPHVKRAELIGGIVYMPSPVGVDHGDMESPVGMWLTVYAAFTPGCVPSHNATAIVQGESPQPDVHLRLLPEVGGRTKVQGKLLLGAPELITEVCVSRTSFDLNQKFDLYEKAGVNEYVTVLMQEREIRWHRVIDGRLQRQQPDADGIWRSVVFPGLWLDGKALLEGDNARVLAVLQQGLNSPEHAAFVAELNRRRSS